MGAIFLPIILFIYNTIAFHNLGVAILEIAVLSRVIFYPLARQQMHYSKKMSELQPHLSLLKEKHKDNKQAMAAAQMELFKQHGVNPAAGCLPALVQWVVLIGLLGAMNQILTMHLQTKFLVWDMAKPDSFKIPSLQFALPGFLVIMSSITYFIQSKMMFPAAPKVRKEDSPPEKVEKKEFAAEFAEAQASMVWMFPLLFLFLGTQWPSGLALYWSVSTLLTIIQQYQVSGLGGLEPYVIKFRKLARP